MFKKFTSEEIKRNLSISYLLSYYGLTDKLRISEKRIVGPCPVHSGDNPTAFHVDISKNIWNCFTQCCGGSVLDFIMNFKGYSFKDAVLLASELLKNSSGYPKTVFGLKEKSTPVGIEKDPKSINKPLSFKLNLNPSHGYFLKRGINEETVKLFGAGYLEKGRYAQTICFPILNGKGEIAAYSSRNIDHQRPKGIPKYKFFPHGCKKSSFIYNISGLTDPDSDFIVVVEGFFGAMRVFQSGYRNVVGLMTSHLSEDQACMLIHQNKKIILMLDGDSAGRRGTKQAINCLKGKADVRAVYLPDGIQPDSMSINEIDLCLEFDKFL